MYRNNADVGASSRWYAFRRKFDLWAVLLGDNVYRYQVTYRILDLLMPDVEYVNYGLWSDGIGTKSPGRELVKAVAQLADLSAEDVVLNIGTGLGRPDIDLVKRYDVRRIIGVNLCAEQVVYSTDLVRANNLSNRIKYLSMDAADVDSASIGDGCTAVISIEALTEVRAAAKMFRGVFDLLPDQGRLVFADLVLKDVVNTSWAQKKILGRLYLLVAKVLFNNCWRTQSRWIDLLEKTGFQDIQTESMGDKSFPHFGNYFQLRYPRLRVARIPWLYRALTRLEVLATCRLYRWDLIDYVLVRATKAQPGS